METLLKIDIASFQNFSSHYQASQLPKSREIRLELMGEDLFRVQISKLKQLLEFEYRLAVPILRSTQYHWSFYRDGKESYTKVQLPYLLL